MKNLRTDLALETHEYFTENAQKISGVSVYNTSNKNTKITHIEIKTDEGAQKIGKPIGNYITIEFSNLKYLDKKASERIIRQIATEIKMLISDDINKPILVVGMGNQAITSDSLGPEVVDRLVVTRHIFSHEPQILSENFASVSALSPGVLGITGIETEEIISAVSKKIDPSCVIVIDALAARKINRIASTIQICDTGICPGSGVGNNRHEISEKTLGVPVIAVGVPTVIDAITITKDTLSTVFNSDCENFNFDNVLKSGKIPEELVNFTTTPKEIDILIKKCAEIVANGINFALHDEITFEDIDFFVN